MVVDILQRGNLVRGKVVMEDMVREREKVRLIVVEERYLKER